MEETDVSRSSDRDGAWRRQMLAEAVTEMGHGGDMSVGAATGMGAWRRLMLAEAVTEMGHGGDRC